MIKLTDNPLSIDKDCFQSSCFFDKDGFDALSAQHYQVELPDKLDRAVPKRKAEFIAGRYCARQALNQLGWEANTSIGIGDNRQPLWPPGIIGSITHSKGFASVALAQQSCLRAVGIDSEYIIEEKTANNVASQILTADENYEDNQSLVDSSRQYLTLIFSAKESVFKCLYSEVKKYFGFEAALITLDQQQPGRFTFELLKDLNTDFKKHFIGEGIYKLESNFIHTAIVLPHG